MRTKSSFSMFRGWFGPVTLSFIVFAGVTLCMLYHIQHFAEATGVSHPQIDFASILAPNNHLRSSLMGLQGYHYTSFHVLDLFFLGAFFTFLYCSARWIRGIYSSLGPEIYLKIFIGFAVATVLSDVAEQLIYLGVLCPEGSANGSVGYIPAIKEGLFALTLLCWFAALLPSRGRFYMHAIRFIGASLISIILLLLIGFGLTFLDQGATLVVHLYDSQSASGLVSIVMTVFCINMLAILISHFPEYFDIAIKKTTKVNWHLHRIVGPFGMITYHASRDTERANAIVESERVKSVTRFLRYLLGLLTYVAWLYVVYSAYAMYEMTALSAFGSVTLFSGFVVLIFTKVFRRFERAKFDVKSQLANKVGELDIKATSSHKYMVCFARWYYWMVLATLGVGIGSLAIIYLFGWHPYSFVATIVFLLCNAVSFVLFRTVRSSWQLISGDRNFLTWQQQADRQPSGVPSKSSLIEGSGLRDLQVGWHRKLLLSFSSNYYFLRRIRIGGVIALIFLLVMNLALRGEWVTHYSSIPIFLAFLVNLYALIVLVLKHILLYTSDHSKWSVANVYGNILGIFYRDMSYRADANSTNHLVADTKFKSYFKGSIAVAFICLAIVTVTDRAANIHKLNMVPSTNTMSISEYADSLHITINRYDCRPMIQVASYGGGLKSNLWNMLIMDELDGMYATHMRSQDVGVGRVSILERCISLSGVSGGAVGLGNYLMLDHMDRLSTEPYDRHEKITNIGKENILAIDMAGILIHDSTVDRFLVDDGGVNRDRAHYAMKRYHAILTDGVRLAPSMQKSQTDVWREMYDSGDAHIPALIINTASTGPSPGVAMSLDGDASSVFPGFIDLEGVGAEDGGSSSRGLTYYDAISTSNRFPIMSPAAQVENLGFFLDGGYFENSGLLTTSYFRDYLRLQPEMIAREMDKALPMKTVTILNSKDDYIRNFIAKNEIKIGKIQHTTNIKSIISGIIDINKLPNVLLQKEQTDSVGLVHIYMPHPITTADVEAQLRGSVLWTSDLLSAIKANNDTIRSAVTRYYEGQSDAVGEELSIRNRGLVVPPLARTLSEPAVQYEIAMVYEHPEVCSQLKKVIYFLVPPDDE